MKEFAGKVTTITVPGRRLSAAAFVFAAAILIAACSSSDDSAADTAAPAATTPPSETTTSTVSSAPATTPVSTTAPPTSTPRSSTTPSTSSAPTTTPDTEPEMTQPAPSIRSLIDEGVVMNLAHAGGDQAAPHSTPFAFAEAVRGGANALELDVQLTADGVLIVQHDDTVDKTTESTGPVAELTLAEIQVLDNAYWFSTECWPCHDRPVEEYVYRGVRTGDVAPPAGYNPDDFKVPTFREVATAFPNMPLDIEIKGSFPDAVPVAEQLAAELAELGREDSVVVVSFDDQVVDAFHELAPDVSVSPGLERLTDWFLNGTELAPHFEVLQLPPFQGEIEIITADLVERIHDEGRVVWVWPDDATNQENAAFYQTLVDAGVDGVIAGRPAEMAAVTTG